MLLALVLFFQDVKKKFSLKDSIGAHKGFFIRRRAGILGKQHPDWVAEADQPQLKARLERELGVVDAFITTLLGTRKAPGRLGGPTEPGSPSPAPQTQEFVAAPATGEGKEHAAAL